MTTTQSGQRWEVPQGASPMAEGEEIVLQVCRRTTLVTLLGVLAILFGLIVAVLGIADGKSETMWIALLVAVACVAAGILVLCIWRPIFRRGRLTATTRRVVFERVGTPEKTVEIEYSPTFSVTLEKNLETQASIGILLEGGGKKLRLAGISKMKEVAGVIAGLREMALGTIPEEQAEPE